MCNRRKVIITGDEDVWQHERDTSSADEDDNCCCTCSQTARDRIKVILLVVGVIVGISAGIGLRYVPAFRESQHAPRFIMYLGVPAELIGGLTALLTLPMMICSLVSIKTS